MRKLLIPVLILLAAGVWAAQSPVTTFDSTCAIQGVVMNFHDGTHEPLSGVKVTFDLIRGHSFRLRTTDSQGRFEVSGIPAGRYALGAERDGFTEQPGAARALEDSGQLELKPGERLSGLTVVMVPAGSISGQVYDEDGQPAPSAEVWAMTAGPADADGKHGVTFQRLASANDRGEFRISGLPEGQYYLKAERPGGQVFRSAVSARDGHPLDGNKRRYVPVYSPLLTSVPLKLRGGQEIAGATLKLQTVPTVTVKGHVLCDGRELFDVSNMSLWNKHAGILEQENVGGFMRDGFYFNDVLPGSYILSALGPVMDVHVLERLSEPTTGTDESGAPVRLRSVPRSALLSLPQYSGSMNLEVGDGGVDGVNLIVKPVSTFTINGHCTLEGGDISALKGLMVFLERANREHERANVELPPDGDFQLQHVVEGTYQLDFVLMPAGYFLKSATLDGSDVLSNGVTVDAKHPPQSMELVVSANGATVEGVVEMGGQPFAGATVAVVPNSSDDHTPYVRYERLKPAVSDQNGHFRVRGLPPGDYTAYAWEAIAGGAYYNADFLARFAHMGEDVHVGEGSHAAVKLTLIPESYISQ